MMSLRSLFILKRQTSITEHSTAISVSLSFIFAHSTFNVHFFQSLLVKNNLALMAFTGRQVASSPGAQEAESPRPTLPIISGIL